MNTQNAQSSAPTAKHTLGLWKWWDEKSVSPRPDKYDLAKLETVDGHQIFTIYGGAGIEALGKSPQAKANAAFIVRACNAHEDLLAACEALEASLLAAFEEKPKLFEQAITLAHAAIAKAKASGPA